MPKKNNLTSILIIMIAIVSFISVIYFFSLGTAFPNQYPIYRVEFDFPRAYTLEDFEGSIQLPDGANLEKINKISLDIKACSNEEDNIDVFLDGKKRGAISFKNCEFLNYADKTGEQPYIHYETKSVSYGIDGLDSETILYSIELNNADLDIQEKTLTVIERVECTRDTHCVESAPICDQIVHKCRPSKTGETPKIVYENEEPKKSFDLAKYSALIIVLVLITIISIVLYFTKFRRRKK